jgi:hypothetical protein
MYIRNVDCLQDHRRHGIFICYAIADTLIDGTIPR